MRAEQPVDRDASLHAGRESSRSALAFSALALSLLSACNPPCKNEPGDLCLLVGTGEYGFNQDGKAGPETDMYLPSAARPGPDALTYIVDFNNQRLRRVEADGTVQTLVGSGFHAIAALGVPLLDTPLENPIDMRFLSDGTIVFVSYHDPRVLVVGADDTLSSLAGAGDGITGTLGNEGDGGPASAALFIQLDGIVIGPNDEIYVSDSLANRIRKIEGGIIDTIAGTGEAAYSGDGGPAVAAALHWPTALELDDAGNLYFADTLNHAIRRVAVDGTITSVAGTGVEGFAGDGGPATAARFNQPFGIALDREGSIYVADRGNFRVRKIDPDGNIETVVGTGEQGPGDEGPALDSTLGFCARIAIDDEHGRLLITDQSNAKIWYLQLR